MFGLVYIYLATAFTFWKLTKNKNLILGFEKVKDLVRGTVVTGNINDLYAAYECFKKIEGVEIVDIKNIDKLDQLQNITVNYVFEERFIGEMQFRYDKPMNYDANHFIYELYRSTMKIEMLQSLNK